MILPGLATILREGWGNCRRIVFACLVIEELLYELGLVLEEKKMLF